MKLWIREAWANHYSSIGRFVYRADYPAGRDEAMTFSHEFGLFKWRPSIHMPRKVSRITLEVINVRVERLQDISINDAIAEGMLLYDGWQTREYQKACAVANENGIAPPLGFSPNERFGHLWDKLNARRGFGLDVNPWVWVIEFKRIKEGE